MIRQWRNVPKNLTPITPINIQFTSGTTGAQKARDAYPPQYFKQRLFHRWSHELNCQWPFVSLSRSTTALAWYWATCILTHGGTIVYPNDGFDPITVLETVQKEQCTGLHGVPTMFIAELDHPDFANYDLSTLRTGIMAGSKLSDWGHAPRDWPNAHERSHHCLMAWPKHRRYLVKPTSTRHLKNKSQP